MGLIRRCSVCRKQGARYSAQGLKCTHKEATWAVKFLVGSKQIFKTFGPNKREAERFLTKIKSEIASGGTFEQIKPILFKELAEKWLNNHRQSANPKPGTIWAYDSRLTHHILPLMGHKVVNQITAYDIETIKQKVREKLRARSTNQVLVEIGTILKYGWTLGFCKSNPAQLVKKYGIERGPGRTLTKEEAAILLRYATEPYRTILFALLCTGARIGEISALKWTDVDFKNNLITIQRNVFHAPKGKYGMGDKSWIFGTPKSKESTRKVFMIPALKTALVRHCEQSGGNQHGLVFSTKFGEPYDRSTLRVKLVSITKAAGLKHVRLHDLRHTNATWLLAEGVNLAYVSKHLGHSGVAITGDTYHHVLPKEHERGMKLLDGIFPIWDTIGIQSLPPPDEIKRK
ncbi:MAG: site-specific integrase [Candidatus Omnitrophica bacterium]|nr:site-specific integrase [Candidatus Omnitrophota bacterium]